MRLRRICRRRNRFGRVFSTVSMDQCRHESAMIMFTVMDHDVITSNDFAGEAFVSLNSIPGVRAPLPHDINAIDRVDLILMHQQNKGNCRVDNRARGLRAVFRSRFGGRNGFAAFGRRPVATRALRCPAFAARNLESALSNRSARRFGRLNV